MFKGGKNLGITVLALFILLIGSQVGSQAAFGGVSHIQETSELSLEIDGQEIETDLQLEQGRTMVDASSVNEYLPHDLDNEIVPVRETFEEIGAEVSWVSATETVEINLEDRVVEELEEDVDEEVITEDEVLGIDHEVLEQIDVDHAMEHVEYLAQDIGTRPAGTSDEHKAADYLVEYYQDLGYEVNKQEFPVGFAGPEMAVLANVEIEDGEQWYGEIDYDHETEYGDDYPWGTFEERHGTEWEMWASPGGLITEGKQEVRAEVVNVGSGDIEDIDEKVEDKIVLVEGDFRQLDPEEFGQIVVEVEDEGGDGVIIYNSGGPGGALGQAFPPYMSEQANIPVLGASYIHGIWLEEMVANSDDGVELTIDTVVKEDLTSYNVEATKSADDENAPIIAVTGHYDSVVSAPGANDNASGTAATMEMARVFKEYDGDVELRFINFGAEEVGLVGSRYYVEQLSQDEQERFKGVYNPDMVATSDPYIEHLFAQTVDGEPNLVTDSMKEADKALGYEEVAQGQFSASDHLPFHEAGIPAALFIHMSGEGTQEDFYTEPVYHTPLDTVEDNICEDRYEKALEIIGTAVLDVIN
ncbi:M28 family peptidase [Natranaerobius thermophilus]|uniref:Peptidase M28 n=1 Tax=Natranaerobius thermophilus (strain ATCC BAA-1301 / DSM 18059 / JW/NM-WN-LF) TaxID=457570 RepID=B2A0U1_NATTJ|nr:M28 family peptidase [Natranaerobius thermophilus]ACB85971.1 peptidase M28 [Natranaerobius thermophilus JW/NM-WN-LF]